MKIPLHLFIISQTSTNLYTCHDNIAGMSCTTFWTNSSWQFVRSKTKFYSISGNISTMVSANAIEQQTDQHFGNSISYPYGTSSFQWSQISPLISHRNSMATITKMEGTLISVSCNTMSLWLKTNPGKDNCHQCARYELNAIHIKLIP